MGETKLTKSRSTSRFSKFLSVILSLSLIPIIVISGTSVEPANAANVSCSGSMAKQNNYIASPSHGQVFYIDSGVTPKNDASYIGYSIGNYTGSTVNNLWVTVSNFNGVLSLVNPDDQYQQIETIPNNDSSTVFFLIKASGASNSAQTHTVKIYAKRPDLNGATPLLTCDYTLLSMASQIFVAVSIIRNFH